LSIIGCDMQHHDVGLYDVCRTWLGLRCISAGSQSDAVVSAVDSLVLLHAFSARYRQPGASFIYARLRLGGALLMDGIVRRAVSLL